MENFWHWSNPGIAFIRGFSYQMIFRNEPNWTADEQTNFSGINQEHFETTRFSILVAIVQSQSFHPSGERSHRNLPHLRSVFHCFALKSFHGHFVILFLQCIKSASISSLVAGQFTPTKTIDSLLFEQNNFIKYLWYGHLISVF